MAGEPAGIGPDLCVMLAHKSLNAKVVVIADADMLKARAAQLKLALKINPYIEGSIQQHFGDSALTVLHSPSNSTVIAGSLNV